MKGFDDLWIWHDPEFAGRLDWYRDVAADRRPAKFRIGATIPLAVGLAPQRVLPDPARVAVGGVDARPAILGRLDRRGVGSRRL